MERPLATVAFAECNMRRTPPGKVFWIVEKENKWFVWQRHKADRKPILGEFVAIRGLWSGKHYAHRILLKTPRCFEIAVAEDPATLQMAWDWLCDNLLPMLEKDQKMPLSAQLEFLKKFFEGRRWTTFDAQENFTMQTEREKSEKDTISSNNSVTTEENDDNFCKICFEKEINCALVECGHAALCLDCSNGLQDCPICRQPIKKVLKLYKS
eukprot:TRINITY_DN10575_c0_g1_i1.p1 TRINITY_DN10575_c0_g1~~TRINITY_DN10575_c0_g1_i1.p1  ORF type:complete len:211 (+),score=31.50 TRINITY_DN10575_c0_g1_i1:112-744(+)